MFLKNLFALAFCFLFNASASFAATPATYEAWYETLISVPGQAPQKGKLHTFFDGKRQYSLQEDNAGNKSGTVFEIPFDSTLVDYMKMASAKSIGKKVIDGKSCDGWSYADQIMKRPSVNWIDESGHLYFQEIEKYEGPGTRYEQRRKNFKENPTSSDLTSDPNCKP